MLAATTSSIPGGAAGVFLQFSVLGAVALLGLWFVLTAYRREVARGDAAEKALAELNREVRDKVIPALTDAARAMSDCVGLLRNKR